jgi:hypothetical protein
LPAIIAQRREQGETADDAWSGGAMPHSAVERQMADAAA